MGFLTVNKKRYKRCPETNKRVKFSAKSIAKKKEMRRDVLHTSRKHVDSPNTSNNKPKSNLSPIERLPREILEEIFIHCANFNLPQASFTLASKLSRTHFLEMMIIREKMAEYDGRLPTSITQLPFLTRKHLEAAGVTEFCSENKESTLTPYVPLTLESKLQNQNVLDVVCFMIEHGCIIENSQKVYLVLAQANKWSAVEKMIISEQEAPLEVVHMALEQGLSSDLVVNLLRLSKRGDATEEMHYTVLWKIQEFAKRACLDDVIAASKLLVNG